MFYIYVHTHTYAHTHKLMALRERKKKKKKVFEYTEEFSDPSTVEKNEATFNVLLFRFDILERRNKRKNKKNYSAILYWKFCVLFFLFFIYFYRKYYNRFCRIYRCA